MGASLSVIVYLVVMVILYGLYAWFCGQIKPGVLPILFFGILFWPVMIVLVVVMAPFIVLNLISQERRDAQIRAADALLGISHHR